MKLSGIKNFTAGAMHFFLVLFGLLPIASHLYCISMETWRASLGVYSPSSILCRNVSPGYGRVGIGRRIMSVVLSAQIK